MERSLRAGERLVHAVPQLVCKRQHVAAFTRVVEEDVGMVIRHRRCAESAWDLAGPRWNVDPSFLEEPAGEPTELPRERGVAIQHHVPSVVPLDLYVVLCYRGHPVVVGQLLDAEDLRLQRVPPLREAIAVSNRGDQRLDRFVRRLLREVEALQPVVVGA